MPHVYASSRVAASAEEIFGFLADYRNIPRLQPQFGSARSVGEHERGLGAIVELKGHFHGMPMTVKNKIVTFTPPYRMVSISDGTVLSRNTWELRPVENSGASHSTEVSLTVEYKIKGALGAIFTGVASSLFHTEIQAMTDQSLQRLQEMFASHS